MESSETKGNQGPESRLSEIEQRIARIETFLNLNKQARTDASEPAAAGAPVVRPIPAYYSPPPPPASPAGWPQPPAAPGSPARPKADLLSGAGAGLTRALTPRDGNWLGVVGVICFVLAAGFMIKLSIDSGWLTPVRQIGLAVLFGLGLIGAGLLMPDKDRDYASLLPGAGVIILYLAVFAAHRFHSLIPFEAAIALTGVVSGLCVWLYTRIREDVYPVTAAAGSYLAPVLLGLGSFTTFTIYYILLCSLAFALISVWVQSRTLTMVSAYLAILLTAFIGLSLQQDTLIAAMLALNFVVFATGTYLYTMVSGTPLTEREANWCLPVLVVFYAMEYHFLHRIQPDLAPWLSLGFAGFLFALYFSVKKWFPEGGLASLPLIVSFMAIVFFHSFYLEILPDEIRPWLFVAIVFVAAVYGVSASAGTMTKALNSLYIIPIIAVFAILAIEYIGMAWQLLSGKEPGWMPVSLCSFASLWVLIYSRGGELKGRDGYTVLLAAAHLLAILAFYRLTTDISSLAVSGSWLVYAVAVMAFAFSQKDEVLAKSATFVLGFAAVKALLVDASSAPTTVRIMCLLFTGAVLYGAGFLFRTISAWGAEPAGRAKPAQTAL